jgi:RHS repeat-associated protein
VLEYDGATGALLRWYSYALSPNGLLNQMNVAAATRATFLPDQLGSIIASFDSTSGGLTKTGYQAYGTSASVSTPFGYTGQRFDPENTFYYYRARNYSTAYGRFLQTDPSGAPSDARGGYSSKANLYAYALNDPLNRIDPMGMASDSSGYGGYSTGSIIGEAFLGATLTPAAGFQLEVGIESATAVAEVGSITEPAAGAETTIIGDSINPSDFQTVANAPVAPCGICTPTTPSGLPIRPIINNGTIAVPGYRFPLICVDCAINNGIYSPDEAPKKME